MNEQGRLESAATHNTLNTSRAIIALKMQLYYLKSLFRLLFFFNKSQNFSDNVTYRIMELQCVEDLKTQIVNFLFYFFYIAPSLTVQAVCLF